MAPDFIQNEARRRNSCAWVKRKRQLASRGVARMRQKAPGATMIGELFEELRLPDGGQVVKDIEEDDVAAEVAGGQHIAHGEGDIAVAAPGDIDQRRKKAAFAQIEFEKADPATDIQHGLRRMLEKFESGGEMGRRRSLPRVYLAANGPGRRCGSAITRQRMASSIGLDFQIPCRAMNLMKPRE